MMRCSKQGHHITQVDSSRSLTFGLPPELLLTRAYRHASAAVPKGNSNVKERLKSTYVDRRKSEPTWGPHKQAASMPGLINGTWTVNCGATDASVGPAHKWSLLACSHTTHTRGASQLDGSGQNLASLPSKPAAFWLVMTLASCPACQLTRIWPKTNLCASR
jgi:hypothetical protein